jgi:hypothetical protein
MATTTPNYGWTVPTSTDLVKDGATAIETLGDAIDASMNTALGTKKAGMVLLNTTSFSGVASQSINSVFNSTYTTYKIIFRGLSTGTFAFTMRMRASGTDSSSSYYWSGQYQDSSTTSEGGENGLNVSSFQIGGVTNQRGFLSLDINNPFEAEPTTFTSVGWDGTYKREDSQQDVYVWRVKVSSYDDKIYYYEGTVTLLR